MEQNGNDILPYAAFLRGINVGGNRSIKMAELRTAFAAQGFTNVKTVLASGNVLFDTAETDAAVLCRQSSNTLSRNLGTRSSCSFVQSQNCSAWSLQTLSRRLQRPRRRGLTLLFSPMD